MRLHLFALLGILGNSALAGAEERAGGLNGDIAFMYGEIQQVRMWEELCSVQFPSTMEQNRAAVNNWRERNKGLVQEIDRRFSDAVVGVSKGDPARHSALVLSFKETHEVTRKNLNKMLIAGGMDRFRKQCEHYPGYLTSSEMNMELSRKDILQSIRRGAK